MCSQYMLSHVKANIRRLHPTIGFTSVMVLAVQGLAQEEYSPYWMGKLQLNVERHAL